MTLKTISTLVKDIQNRITSNEPFEEAAVTRFGRQLASILAARLSRGNSPPSLRVSNLGTPCDRKLWYSINRAELAEPLSPSAKFKFLFGDIIEEVILFLAKAAGHTVEAEQAEVNLHGVKGHIDAVIDGELVDVKSASTYSFNKFKTHELVNKDDFGYRTQLHSYLTALRDPALHVTNRAHFLAIDKTLGNITLDTHTFPEVDYERLVDQKRKMLAFPKPPSRGYNDEADGKSGNRKLGVACSYCPFKTECWPGLRAFAYSRGPMFLTQVVYEPKVPELSPRQSEEKDSVEG